MRFLLIFVNCFFLSSLAHAGDEIALGETQMKRARQYEMKAEQSLREETVDDHESADDFSFALQHYQEAAKLGNLVAKCRLGRFYQMDHPGIPRNDQEALYWLLVAGDFGKMSLEDLLARLSLKRALSYLLPMLENQRINREQLREALLQAHQFDLWHQVQTRLSPLDSLVSTDTTA